MSYYFPDTILTKAVAGKSKVVRQKGDNKRILAGSDRFNQTLQ